jgi:hypothetical protein
VKTVVRAVTKKDRLALVGALIEVVTELVMDGGEILRVHLDAHLDPQIVFHVDVPRAGVADDLPIPGLGEQRALPEGLGQGGQSQGREKPLPVADHLDRLHPPIFEDPGEVIAGIDSLGSQQRIDVHPALRPHVAE